MQLHLKQFDISVEQVTLGDMDTLEAKLMDELQDSSGNDSLSACASTCKRPLRLGVFQNNPVQFWDIDLVALRS